MLKKIFFILFTGLLLACSSDDPAPDPDNGNGGNGNNGGEGTTGFDRAALLANWADNIIVPAYQDFYPTTEALEVSVTAFRENPTAVNLEQVRTDWLNAYRAFQWVSMFETGPAEDLRFRARLNTYPADTATIDEFIATGTYDLELPSTIDAQGFPALDYLLFGIADTEEEIIDFYENDPTAVNTLVYMQALAVNIKTLTSLVRDLWQSSFAASFKANTDASATGSIDKLTNDFIFYYEKALRAGKIGIPAGVFSTDPLPQNVEAFYNQEVSKELALEALLAVQNFFNGTGANGGNGRGFKSYLDFLNTIKNGEDLSTLINEQFDLARLAINDLDDNFATQVQTDNIAMLEAYDELQRNVILIKVDMLQALSIDVDFVDTDGD
ncbi:imelysin family protein [Gilvibacter sediminis]|uniref:imelysin family protein n=1 Tax=Gilvibacter sediminis TaxID=379071 RepID=UPI002350825A|nr:imelysin family protein [Gilvibacter sediminis]MDC7999214.1 imelysin family protein [Gilvibacter sediminis]